MLNQSLRCAALAALFILGTASGAVAQYDGVVKVASSAGPATLTTADGAQQPVIVESLVPIGATITTGEDAAVVLIFSNGAVLSVEPESEVTIVRYETEDVLPADADDFGEHDEEPTGSRTLLDLESGEISGDVPELQDGSTFEVETPSGTAGVRGTIVTVGYRYNANTDSFDLVIGFTDGNGYFRLPSGQIVEVPSGNQIVIGIDGSYEIEVIEEAPAAEPALDLQDPEAPEPDLDAINPTIPEEEPGVVTPQFGEPSGEEF